LSKSYNSNFFVAARLNRWDPRFLKLIEPKELHPKSLGLPAGKLAVDIFGFSRMIGASAVSHD
jgi:hypothetical protein